jgi:antitoxin VapB
VPKLTRIFRSGNSQAVRLPKEFQIDAECVEITREGDALILRPHVDHPEPWSSLRAAMRRGVSDDFFAGGRRQPAQQDRPDLDRAFE